MKRQFIVNLILLFCINALVKPYYVFFVETEVQNLLGTAVFGIYFYHLNFVFLFQFLGDFGLQTYNNQYISKNRDKVNVHLPNVFIIKLLLSALWIFFVLGAGYIFGNMQWEILLLVCFNLILSSVFLLFRSFISGLGHYTWDSWLSAADKFFMILILTWYFLRVENGHVFTMHDFIYGQMFALVCANLLALIILGYHTKSVRFSWPKESIKKILVSCYPYAIILFLMMSYNKMDGFLLGYLLDDRGVQAGIYAATYRIYDAANMFLYLVAALILPMFSNMLGTGQDVKPLTNLVFRWLFGMIGPVLVLSVYFSEELINLLYIEHISEKIASLRILMLAFALVSFAYVYGALSLAGDKISKLIPVFGTGLMINLICNLVLIPSYGASGAAISACITQAWVFIGQMIIVRREFQTGLSIDVTIRGLGYMILILISAWMFTTFFEDSSLWPLVFCIIISLPLAFFLKLIEISDIKLVFNKN